LQLGDQIGFIFNRARFESRGDELDPFCEERPHIEIAAHCASKETIENPAAVNSCTFLINSNVLSADRVSDNVHTLARGEFKHFLSDALFCFVIHGEVRAHLLLAKS